MIILMSLRSYKISWHNFNWIYNYDPDNFHVPCYVMETLLKGQAPFSHIYCLDKMCPNVPLYLILLGLYQRY